MSIKNNIETSIKFGGFYESIHSSNIDHMVEAFEYDFDHVDYKKTHQDYIENYSYNLSDYIYYQYKVIINFNKVKLYSPEYYNYSTDTIDCKIKSNQVYDLNKVIKKDKNFLEYLKNATTNYDGFISFYTFNEALSNKNNILIMYVLEYISNKYNDSILYDLPEFNVYLNKEGQKIENEKMEANERQIEFESNQLNFQF